MEKLSNRAFGDCLSGESSLLPFLLRAMIVAPRLCLSAISGEDGWTMVLSNGFGTGYMLLNVIPFPSMFGSFSFLPLCKKVQLFGDRNIGWMSADPEVASERGAGGHDKHSLVNMAKGRIIVSQVGLCRALLVRAAVLCQVLFF
jgi:hypothetical protein